jgi:hypothetical protein
MSHTKNTRKNIRQSPPKPVPRVQHRSCSRCAFITLFQSSAQASRCTPRALTTDTWHAYASYPYPPPRHLPSAPSSDDCPALAISSCAFRMTSLASRAAPRSCGLAALLSRKQILSHHRVQDGAHTCACVRECVCACVRVCVHLHTCACVHSSLFEFLHHSAAPSSKGAASVYTLWQLEGPVWGQLTRFHQGKSSVWCPRRGLLRPQN